MPLLFIYKLTFAFGADPAHNIKLTNYTDRIPLLRARTHHMTDRFLISSLGAITNNITLIEKVNLSTETPNAQLIFVMALGIIIVRALLLHSLWQKNWILRL